MKTVLLLGAHRPAESVEVHSDRDICPHGPLGPIYYQVSRTIGGQTLWFGVQEGDEHLIEAYLKGKK